MAAVPTTYIPLTTTFSAPLACSSQFVLPAITVNQAIFAFDPGHKVKDPTALDCSPEQAVEWWAQDAAQTSTGIGGTTMICPNLYTTAYTTPLFVDDKTKTLIACCPSSYEIVALASAGNAAQCRSVLKPGTVSFIVSGTDGLFTRTSSLLTTSSFVFGVQINGYITQASSTSTSTTTITLTTTSASSTVSTTPSATSSNTPSSGLSTGAQAGIGAGVGALALLAILGAFLWYRRRNRNKAVEVPAEGYYPPEGKGLPPQELGATRTDGAGYYQPTKPPAPQELNARPNNPSELA